MAEPIGQFCSLAGRVYGDKMTLSAGTGFNAVGREIFGFSNQIDFSTVSSGDDITAFDFTSPIQLYLVELQPGINTNGMAANDILSLIDWNNLQYSRVNLL